MALSDWLFLIQDFTEQTFRMESVMRICVGYEILSASMQCICVN